jgi:hypothetical protein
VAQHRTHDPNRGAHGIHGVEEAFLGIHKTQEPCHQRPVERQGRTGQRTAAQGANVDPIQAINRSLPVAFEHLDVGPELSKPPREGAIQEQVQFPQFFESDEAGRI